jgi:uncharacterized membrane-anchored protein
MPAVTRAFHHAMFALLLLISGFAAAEDAPAAAPQLPGIVGPSEVKLRDQAVLHLPAGFIFVPRPDADEIMKHWGNSVDERFLGLILPAGKEDWAVVADWEPSGYIRDDDAKNWNVDDMLENFREGTKAANEERVKQGFKPLEVVGWVQKPDYNSGMHQLVWSMAARNEGEPDDKPSINFNTYALGREGYITLNLITDLDQIGTYKSQASTLLANLEFVKGKQYGDFNESTDNVAEYGLAALVGGVAAKKLGLFAVIAAFVAKFAKLIIAAVVGLGIAAKRIFKRGA